MDIEFLVADIAVPFPDDRPFVDSGHVVFSRCFGSHSPLDAKPVNLSNHRVPGHGEFIGDLSGRESRVHQVFQVFCFLL